jgi:hypothetical protein
MFHSALSGCSLEVRPFGTHMLKWVYATQGMRVCGGMSLILSQLVSHRPQTNLIRGAVETKIGTVRIGLDLPLLKAIRIS